MMSVDDALALIAMHRPDCRMDTVSLLEANGHTLAQDVFAGFTQPSAPTSAMDGYALRKDDLPHELMVVGESRAGQPYDGALGEKQAVRIFTGAILPPGADYVEIQEHARRSGKKLSFSDTSKGQNYVRAIGSNFTKDDLLFKAGTKITPSVISSIASANLASVPIKRKPSIALLRCGDELRPLGSTLECGQIIDSNGPVLLALLTGWGFDVTDQGLVSDDQAIIQEKVSSCDADIIIPVGGASVGDYDFMKSAIAGLGFNPVFEKVAVKPGKPVWLSRHKKQVVLGLPGNPHSVWVCAHLFLAHLLGRTLEWRPYRLKTDMPPNGIRERLVRGVIDANAEVTPMTARGVSTLSKPQTEVLIRRAPLADDVLAGHFVDCLHINY